MLLCWLLKASRKSFGSALSQEFSVSPDDLVIREGAFVNRETGRQYITVKELAQGSERFEYEAQYKAPTTQPPPAYSESYPEVP